jgi:hypothetical protein
MTHTINDNLEVTGNTETVAKFSRSSSDVSALLQSGSGNEVYLRFKNSETGNNSWMAGMDDDEQFKIAYGADGEIRGAETKLYVAQSGNVGIGTTNPQAKLEVQSPWSDWMFLRQQRNVEGGGGFHIHNPWGNSDQPQGDPSRNRLEISYRTPGGQDLWEQFVLHGPSGNVGIGTANPQAKLHVNGDIIATGDIVLQNADCAEEFAVKDLEVIEPGTVMVLGEEGSLCQSTEAYDKKVAGVVSGAGDLKPGLILDKQPESTNRMPIALMGKVYCKVDAQYTPVEVGDLLTTSPTPGHAMKATDPLKAFGTIIGKALRPLAAGKGLIPILVALQ